MAQEALVDDLVRDCLSALEALEDNELPAGCAEAAEIVGYELAAKTPPVRNAKGLFSKDRFAVDTEHMTVTCPADHVVAITDTGRGGGKARFKDYCADCPMRQSCTTSRRGRTITIHPCEAILQRARKEQADPAWKVAYRADRPIVERKIAHFTRRPWRAKGTHERVTARRHRPRHQSRRHQLGTVGGPWSASRGQRLGDRLKDALKGP